MAGLTMNLHELRQKVLEHLGVVALGETLSADDAKIIDEAAYGVHAALQGRNIAPFALDDIPIWAQLPLRDAVAFEVAHTFGIEPERRAELGMLQQRAIHSLRAQVYAQNISIAPIPTRYF